MEGLNSLLLMHEKYGRETDIYFKAFQRQWQFIRDYQTDAQFHGVFRDDRLTVSQPTPAKDVYGRRPIMMAARC